MSASGKDYPQKRERFTFPSSASGQKGTAVWEENSGISPMGPQTYLVRLLDGFYERFKKKIVAPLKSWPQVWCRDAGMTCANEVIARFAPVARHGPPQRRPRGVKYGQLRSHSIPGFRWMETARGNTDCDALLRNDPR